VTFALRRLSNAGRLQLEASCGEEPAGWDDQVLAAGGVIFHGTPWAHVIRAQGAAPWFLVFRSEGRAVGLAVARGSRSRLPVLGRRRSVLSFQTTPLLEPDVSLEDALEAIRAFARKERFGRLECLSYWARLPQATAGLAQLGFAVRSRIEFECRLGVDLAASLATMSAGHRRNIKKAMAQGLTFREDSTLNGAMVLRDLQDATYGRRHDHGHLAPRPMTRPDYRTTMEAYLDAGAVRFWLVKRDDRPLSALGMLVYGTRAYYLVGGTSAEGYQCRAAFAAFGHAIQALCAAGVTHLHLGGVPDAAGEEGNVDHGLYRFKEAFGAEPVRCWDGWGRA
jgi:hypothetical protein